MAIAPFGLVARDQDTISLDGSGNVIEYDRSEDGDIVLTFDRPIAAFGPGFAVGTSYPFLRDATTMAQAGSSPDAAHTVFTISEAAIESMGGTGISTNGITHSLRVLSLPQYDPINGEQSNFEATIFLRAVP